MVQLVKQNKIIAITLSCNIFPLANLTLDLVSTNIEKRNMQFVTPALAPPYL